MGWKNNASAIACWQIAKDLGVGLVAANMSIFCDGDDHDAHDRMLCIGTGKIVQDESRMRYAPELYFNRPGNARVVQGFPEAITNTLAIGDGVM